MLFMRFEAKLAILIFVLAGPWIIYLGFNPGTSNVIVASGTMLMAFGTFLMAYFTYISYKNLANLQKASLEPALSISLWKEAYLGGESLSDYGVTVKNDGHRIAKKVMLWVDWAAKETKRKVNGHHLNLIKKISMVKQVLKLAILGQRKKEMSHPKPYHSQVVSNSKMFMV